MEHLCKRRRIATEEYSNPEFHNSRARNDQRLKSTFESIFEKYNKDFSEVGDEIDMNTGQIVIDNGHILGMANELDLGDGEASSEEEDIGDSDNNSEDQEYVYRTYPSYHDRTSLDILEDNPVMLDPEIPSDSDSDNDSLMGDVVDNSLDFNLTDMHEKNYRELGNGEKTRSGSGRAHIGHTSTGLQSVEDCYNIRSGAGELHDHNRTNFKSKEESAVEPAWWVPPLPQPTSTSREQRVVANPKIEEPGQLRSPSSAGTSLWAPVEKDRERLSIKSRVVSSFKITSTMDPGREPPVHLQRQVKQTDIVAITDDSSETFKPRLAVLPSETHAVSQYRAARNSGREKLPKLDAGAATKVSFIQQRWTPDEDELLRRLKLSTTLSYDEIKQHFRGRGESAIRYHWHQMLGYMKPKEPTDYRWTSQDNDKLLDLRLKQKLPWERVAEHFENRTTKGVRCHYQELKVAFATPADQLIATRGERPRALTMLTNGISLATRERAEKVLKSSVPYEPAKQITPPSSVKSQPKSTEAIRGGQVMPSARVASSARPPSLAAETIDNEKHLTYTVPKAINSCKAAPVSAIISEAPDNREVHATTAVQASIRNTNSSHTPNVSSNAVQIKLHHHENQLKPKLDLGDRSSIPQQNASTEDISMMGAVIVASPAKKDIRNLTNPIFQKQSSISPSVSPLRSTTSDNLPAARQSLPGEAVEPLEFKISRNAQIPEKLTTGRSSHLDETSSNERLSTQTQSKPITGTPKNCSSRVCRNCKISNSPQWRRGEDGEILCKNCGRSIKQSMGNLKLIRVEKYWARTGLDRPKSVWHRSALKQKRKRSEVLLDVGRNPATEMPDRNRGLPIETASHLVTGYVSPRSPSEAAKGAGNVASLIQVPVFAKHSGSSKVYQQHFQSLQPVDSSTQRKLCSSPITSIESPKVPPRRHMVVADSFSSMIEDLSEDELSFL